jgi:capsular polysaccharide biosynthesis protein
VNDPDRIAWDPAFDGNLEQRLAPYEDPSDLDDRVSEPVTGLVSLGFLWAALGRKMRLLCTLSVIGLIVGAGYYVASPPVYKATTSVLLTDDSSQSTVVQGETDLAVADSLPVATSVVRQLGLPQTPESFLGSYAVAAPSPQILVITASGTTSEKAVQIAQAIAQQFLAFRDSYQQTQYDLLESQLDQQLAAAQQQISTASTDAEKRTAQNNLAAVQQYVAPTLATAKTSLQDMIKGSIVLNAAEPVKVSRTKGIVKYAAGGLVVGLGLGIAIVVIGAITSDKLRRRDDIAYAIGAPVQLSVGRLRASRLRIPGLSGRSAVARRRDVDRIVAHLRQMIPGGVSGPVSLAVVPVDDTATTAEAVVALATSIAKHKRVVVADLSTGAAAARLLGVSDPGVTKVNHDSGPMLVVRPDDDDVAPVGPLRIPDRDAQPDPALVSACAQADLVLSLVGLDPARGGEHLATWATEVVATVTIGRSTATRIHTVREMIQLAGARLTSVVVMDADKADESLGATTTEYLAPAALG